MTPGFGTLGRRRPAVRFLAYWLPAMAYMGVLFWLSSRERGLDLRRLGLWGLSDKWQHIVAYSVLGLLLFRGFHADLRFPTLAAVLCGTLAAVAYGVFDEMHQGFVPGRDMDHRDVVADLVGSLAGATMLAATTSVAACIRRGGGRRAR